MTLSNLYTPFLAAMNKVYGAVVTRQDHWKRAADGGFDYGECDDHPERYYSTFAKDVSIEQPLNNYTGLPFQALIQDIQILLKLDCNKLLSKRLKLLPIPYGR